MYVCMYACMYVCMYLCMYFYRCNDLSICMRRGVDFRVLSAVASCVLAP